MNQQNPWTGPPPNYMGVGSDVYNADWYAHHQQEEAAQRRRSAVHAAETAALWGAAGYLFQNREAVRNGLNDFRSPSPATHNPPSAPAPRYKLRNMIIGVVLFLGVCHFIGVFSLGILD